MKQASEEALRHSAIFQCLSVDDRQRLTAVTLVRDYEKGDVLFHEGDESAYLFTVVAGHVKVVKRTARGSDFILEIFGPGDPVGAVAVYESRPYPATAIAIESATALMTPRQAFFTLLDTRPTLVRGLLVGMTRRLVTLTNRLTEVSGARVEARMARVFLKMSDDLGEAREGGLFIKLALSRQELADMLGTTIETAIRIMSRWGKESIVRTDPDGFLVMRRTALEDLALG